MHEKLQHYQRLAEQFVVKDLIFVLFHQFLAKGDGLFPHLNRRTKRKKKQCPSLHHLLMKELPLSWLNPGFCEICVSRF